MIEQDKMARLEEIRQPDNDLECVRVSYEQFCSVKSHVDMLRMIEQDKMARLEEIR